MLGVVLRCAFGGASILAALCGRRMIHADSLYGMSGPRLIGAIVGAPHFDPPIQRRSATSWAAAPVPGWTASSWSAPMSRRSVKRSTDWVRSSRVGPLRLLP